MTNRSNLQTMKHVNKRKEKRRTFAKLKYLLGWWFPQTSIGRGVSMTVTYTEFWRQRSYHPLGGEYKTFVNANSCHDYE